MTSGRSNWPKAPPGVISLALLGLAATAAALLGGESRAIVFVVWTGAFACALLLARRWTAEETSHEELRVALRALDDVAGAEGDPRQAASGVLSKLETLERDHAALGALLEALPDPVLLLNAEGRILRLNASAERVLGPTASAGASFDDALSDAGSDHTLAATEMHAERSATIRLTTDGAYRSYQISVRDVALAASENGRVVTLSDVTEAASTSQFKADFVANASHELRTPIAAIRAAAETLRGVGRDNAAIRERVLTMVEQNALRLEEMVRDLLDLSRLESPIGKPVIGRFKAAQLEAVLRPMFEPLCEKRGLELEFTIGEEVDELLTDQRLVQLVLRNLIDNAVKFAFPDTKVPVALGADRDGALTLRVVDRGEGIPLAHQQRVFERFYQVDPARSGSGRRGTGLGLAIVKHATRALGGTISLHSVYKEGSEFTVRVPGAVARRTTGPNAAEGQSGAVSTPAS